MSGSGQLQVEAVSYGLESYTAAPLVVQEKDHSSLGRRRCLSFLMQHDSLLIVGEYGHVEILAPVELVLGNGKGHHHTALHLRSGCNFSFDLQRFGGIGLQVRERLQVARIIHGRCRIVGGLALVGQDVRLDFLDEQGLVANVVQGHLHQDHGIRSVLLLHRECLINLALRDRLGAKDVRDTDNEDQNYEQRDGQRSNGRKGPLGAVEFFCNRDVPGVESGPWLGKIGVRHGAPPGWSCNSSLRFADRGFTQFVGQWWRMAFRNSFSGSVLSTSFAVSHARRACKTPYLIFSKCEVWWASVLITILTPRSRARRKWTSLRSSRSG